MAPISETDEAMCSADRQRDVTDKGGSSIGKHLKSKTSWVTEGSQRPEGKGTFRRKASPGLTHCLREAPRPQVRR